MTEPDKGVDDWAFYPDTLTAWHKPSGLTVRFVPDPDEPGAYDGQVLGDLPGELGMDALARLMREAGDGMARVLRKGPGKPGQTN